VMGGGEGRSSTTIKGGAEVVSEAQSCGARKGGLGTCRSGARGRSLVVKGAGPMIRNERGQGYGRG
jgi:hypothetical protein